MLDSKRCCVCLLACVLSSLALASGSAIPQNETVISLRAYGSGHRGTGWAGGTGRSGIGETCKTGSTDCSVGMACSASGRCVCSQGYTELDSSCVHDAEEIQAKMTKVIIALAISAIILTIIAFALILYGRKVTQARRNLRARTEATRLAANAQAQITDDKPPAYEDLSKTLQQTDEPAPPSYDQALRLSSLTAILSADEDAIKPPSDGLDSAAANGQTAQQPSAPSPEQVTGV